MTARRHGHRGAGGGSPVGDSLRINPEIGSETLADLKARGHLLTAISGPLAAAPSVIAIEPGRIRAAGDPRAGRHAMGY
jgi:gamma-glutamyltranspeptidase